VSALRTTSLETVRLVFAREMERVLRELAESGKTAAIARKKRG